jgi:hypothetical protein
MSINTRLPLVRHLRNSRQPAKRLHNARLSAFTGKAMQRSSVVNKWECPLIMKLPNEPKKCFVFNLRV